MWWERATDNEVDLDRLQIELFAKFLLTDRCRFGRSWAIEQVGFLEGWDFLQREGRFDASSQLATEQMKHAALIT